MTTLALRPGHREWVREVMGASTVAATPIGAGASRVTWLVQLDSGEQIVLREEDGAGPVAGTALDLAREASVYRALAGRGLPVPVLHAVSEDGTAMLLAFAPGDASLKGLTQTQVERVSADLGRRLGHLHLLEPGDLVLGPIGALDDLALWADIQATRVVAPATLVAEVALSWLDSHRLASNGRVCLCHGDAGAGNFLHDGEQVTALLDWEFAHLDDPHDDLAWVAVRNQVQRRPLDIGAVYRSWEATTGRTIEPPALEHHRARVLTRMLISCDAALSAAHGEPPMVQSMLRPYLGLALVEALRRAGATIPSLDGLARAERAQWEVAPVADVLDDPEKLDDLGGPW